MQDLGTQTAQLRRPAILIRTARAGLAYYNRNRDLRRLLPGSEGVPSPEAALRRLSEAEATLDDRRRSGDARYSLTRHVALLIALLAETRLARGAA